MAAHANRGTARKHRRTDKFRKMGGKTSNKRRPRTSSTRRYNNRRITMKSMNNTRRRTRSLYGGVDNARNGYTTDATARWPELRTPEKPMVFTLPGETPITFIQLTKEHNGNPPLFSVEMNGQERISAATPVPFIGDINPFARHDEPRR